MKIPRRHKHVDLIKQWLEDDSLIVEIQQADGVWVPAAPNWSEGLNYRFKPSIILIGDMDVPKPETSPLPDGALYFVPNPTEADKFKSVNWVGDGDNFDKRCLKRGLIHRTEEAAVQHAKALIVISGGKV